MYLFLCVFLFSLNDSYFFIGYVYVFGSVNIIVCVFVFMNVSL